MNGSSGASIAKIFFFSLIKMLIGYVSSSRHERKKFATYLSIHTGKLPDCITAIPQLIWLTILQSPETTILSDRISDSTLKSMII